MTDTKQKYETPFFLFYKRNSEYVSLRKRGEWLMLAIFFYNLFFYMFCVCFCAFAFVSILRFYAQHLCLQNESSSQLERNDISRRFGRCSFFCSPDEETRAARNVVVHRSSPVPAAFRCALLTYGFAVVLLLICCLHCLLLFFLFFFLCLCCSPVSCSWFRSFFFCL